MPKPEWGVKRLCPFCSTRFYDLQHTQMTCPSCGKSFDLAALEMPRGKAARVERPQREPVKAEAEGDLLLDDNDDLDDSDDDVEIDDEILEEEDDDDNVNLDDLADVPADDDES